MRDSRWTTITESQFQHERSGLLYLKELLPDSEPFRAWSNFTFTAHSGHVREVDLLVAAPAGLFLVELKNWQGTLTSSGASWVQTLPGDRTRVHRNPRHLANQKAKELKGLLKDAMEKAGMRRPAPYVQELVFFTNPALRIRLAQNDLAAVVGKASHSGLPDVLGEIQRPVRDFHSGIDPQLSKNLGKLLKSVGIGRSDAEFHVGTYRLDRTPFDTGPNWADYLGHHDSMRKTRRVRIYLRERGADRQTRESISHTAEREALALEGLEHPGLVALENFDENGHSAGPALLYEYDPRTLRLDDYLLQYGDRLDAQARAWLLRQLAETVQYAHRHRLYHRALHARAIHVLPGPRVRGGGEDDRWLRPVLQIAEWQTAVRRTQTKGAAGGSGGTLTSGQEIVPSNNLAAYVAEVADPYLAPEVTAKSPDPTALDVFGLGVLGYLIFTGKPPAHSQAELGARLDQGGGLVPSAVTDGLTKDVDQIIQDATAYRPEARTRTAAEFLEWLDVVERGLRPQPEPDLQPETHVEEGDPLDAAPDDVVGGRYLVKRSLGQGSTARALLAEDRERDNAQVVLKIARADKYAAALRREADVLSKLRNDSKVIHLAVPEPIRIGPRTVLVLDHAGDRTVARQLREGGPLLTDQLETYATYLFAAVDFLDGEGVWHRDLKPDNIAIRVRPNGTRQLVLFDFSLAGLDVDLVKAGTEGYLDPFVETITRGRYDAQAEWYALAATLHEMASGELPQWGDGSVLARQTDPKEWPYPKIAAEAFDSALRDSLVDFFQRALHRDHRKRFADLKEMQRAWQRVFALADQPVQARSTGHPEDEGTPAVALPPGELPPVDPVADETRRNEDAAKATRDTLLLFAGLSVRAVSFLNGLQLNTVGDLLDYSTRRLVNRPGLGARTRDEINRRIKQWRLALDVRQPSPLSPTERGDSAAEIAEAKAERTETGNDRPLRRISLDALVSLLVPKPAPRGRNATEVETVRLLLSLPDETGNLPPELPSWPLNKSVAPLTSEQVTEGRIAQIVGAQRKSWAGDAALRALRDEVVDILTAMGRVASATELAEALVARRGTVQADPLLRRALGMAAVRAAYEVDWAQTPRRIRGRRHGDTGDNRMLLALEVDEDTDAPDTPSAPALLDYADRLGKAADALAGRDTLAGPGTVLEQIVAADAAFHARQPEARVSMDEARMVTLAAAAAQDAAANARLEIYSRSLQPVRALRLTQAGLILPLAGKSDREQEGLTIEQIRDRVHARFPDLSSRIPDDPPSLSRLLRQAGFELRWHQGGKKHPRGRFIPKRNAGGADPTSAVTQRQASLTRVSRVDHWTAETAEQRGRLRARAQLKEAAGQPGFRLLTVRHDDQGRALRTLTEPRHEWQAEPVDVSALFLTSLRRLVEARPRPTWETILEADNAEPGSRDALKFGEYTAAAWGEVEKKIRGVLEGVDGDGSAGVGEPEAASARQHPVLLHDAFVMARYGGVGVLQRLAEAARRGGPHGRGLWLLSPLRDETAAPRLDGVTVPLQDREEWIPLNHAWVINDPGKVRAA
ncbi:BREX system serine/threonine kinase PglW [Streptomyces europaeiscabiei]|uniref:BREX system serine/threonine kinase PglW n=1 Tax=Streptomyces europaeiscabiei TaxID=146819 RepID=A0ABU4NR96_9ACTN|nr:BREX system serine/threonine kinase PglW [Streptomyces europaeiscabiei]MDX3547184.1 BREX system serine/threonine kinase PglW [Streptomyces europaeiscabiei]MDX3556895.1 BREX system serine/threonine kinase PglW [Streptomyces europaeiscabiei]MDX3704593.1 BREX system serine/threonine kinase PglW [Streptomyces europaeiscabiei]